MLGGGLILASLSVTFSFLAKWLLFLKICCLYGAGYIPVCIFPRAISQVTISQVTTFQVCNFPSGNFPKVRFDPLRRRRLQWGPSAATRIGWVLRLEQTRGPSFAARTGLGSYRLGNCKFGKFPLGKYSWEETWEKSFGKISNIVFNLSDFKGKND